MGQSRPLIIQIFPKEKFTKGFIDFNNDAFGESENILFFVYGYGPNAADGFVESKDSNVRYFECAKDIFKDADAVRSLSSSSLVVLNYVNWRLCLRLWGYRSKLLLVFWGGDLYPLSTSFSPSRARVWVKNAGVRFMMSRAMGVSTLIEKDLSVVEKVCPRHAEWHLATIVGLTRKSAQQERDLVAAVAGGPKKDASCRILLGNSAHKTNRHIPMIEALSNYVNEDMVVFAPLSYGDTAHRDEVIETGQQMLGDKFIPITDFMAKEEYSEFLGTIDVGVFNHSRQQGMGNISSLMRRGKKVFIAADSPMWKDFLAQGRVMFDSSTIGKMSFDEFCSMSKQDREKNIELLDPIKRYEYGVKVWKDIYALADEA